MSLTFRFSQRQGRLVSQFGEPAHSRPPPQQPRVPMVYRIDTWTFINPQNSSPFFNGQIPAEIRSLIFEFALTPSLEPDWDRPIRYNFCFRHDHEKLDDEPILAPPSDDETDYDSESEAGFEAGSVASGMADDGSAPAVQSPPASFFNHNYRQTSSGWDWLRPGYTGQCKLYTALLRTCRQIYIETNKIPSRNMKKVFYSSGGPYSSRYSPVEYISQLPPEAARQICHLHIFTNLWWLENRFFAMVTNMPDLLSADLAQPVAFPPPPIPPPPHDPVLALSRILQNPPRIPSSPRRPWRVSEHLTKLRITIRRTDWPGWESNSPLAINPFGADPADRPAHQLMQRDMHASFQADMDLNLQQRHSSPSRVERWANWGLLFLQMVSLKMLTIDFETSEDKRDEMKSIVHWAQQTWRFPVLQRLSGDSSDPFTAEHIQMHHRDNPVDLTPWSSSIRVLTAEDHEVKRSSWRGLRHHFADSCPSCHTRWFDVGTTLGCEMCHKMRHLKDEGKGPQLLVWTVTWTLKSGQNFGDPSAAVSITTGAIAEEVNGEGTSNQPSRSNAINSRQGGGGPSSTYTESHVLAMLSHNAQHRLRLQREVEEILTTKVCF
ncbi:hypothetical protein VM1G_04174 [Cytospora mali]|uniref:Uncharacterized protein n=1 Tax=Cytospora mali TaxID=578113 RepID=A0A194VX96_CYTMA|nr:hypothetical protein VM1G_04174 [Valsa mali]